MSDAGPTPADSPPAIVESETPRVLPHDRPPRPGDLSLGWRAVTAGTWIGVIVGLAAVWNTSVELGLSTWWLGPRSDPQPVVVKFVPFVAPVLMLLATVNQARWLGWWGSGAAVAVGAVAIGDVGRVTSLALIEFAIAGAAALVSIASFTGTYRLAEPDPNVTTSASR